MNPGKRFEKKFLESVDPHGFILRIPDKIYTYQGRIYSDESEADFIIASGTESYLVECKATCKSCLPFEMVKEHQETALLEYDEVGRNAHGLLAVEFYDKAGYRYPKRMFLLPIVEWLKFKASTTRKSMPISEFEKIGIEIPYQQSAYKISFQEWSK